MTSTNSRLRKAMTEDRDKGFTLIELLVVIIIIGILAGVAIPVFLNQRKKGVDAGIKSDLKNLATIVETFNTDNPQSTTAYTAANVGDFKKSPSNVIQIAGNPATGYCLRGSNPNGTATGTAGYFWYDSGAGGLKTGAPTTAFGTTPAAVACAGTPTFVTLP